MNRYAVYGLLVCFFLLLLAWAESGARGESKPELALVAPAALPTYKVIFMGEDSALYKGTLTVDKTLQDLDISPHLNVVTSNDLIWYEAQDTIETTDGSRVNTYDFRRKLDWLSEGAESESWHFEYETANSFDPENPDSTAAPNPYTTFFHGQFPLFMVMNDQDSILMMMSKE